MTKSTKEPEEEWKTLVKTLFESENQNDLKLIIAKISVLIDEAKSQGAREALENVMEEMPSKEKCPCGKFNCHGKGYDDAIDDVLSILQSNLNAV